MASKKMMMIAVLAAAVLLSWTTTEAQDETCVEALIPCQEFLNSTAPPATCCNPLKKAIETQLSCLCGLFNNPALTAGFNMTAAMMLPHNCKIENAGPQMCPKVAPGPGAASGPSSSAAGPSTPSVPSPPPSGNGAAKNIGVAGPISGVMLLIAGLMFY